MQPFTIERLERAIEVVRAAPEHKFDLMYVFHTEDPASDTIDINVCGTTACALGFCALDPWFNERGLRLVHGVADDMRILWVGLGSYWSVDYADASSEFFGLEWELARDLFRPVEDHERVDDTVTDKEIWLDRAQRLLADLKASVPPVGHINPGSTT